MDIGSRLRQLRENANLTQEEVGIQLGVTKATVNRYESGKIDIKRTIAIKLAKILNTTPSYIMGWEDSAKTSSYNLPDITLPSEVDPDRFAIQMYKKLDSYDKAEIRGEMKQMLKADKYADTSKIVDIGRTAAYGGESAQIVVTEERANAISDIMRKIKEEQNIE